MTSVGLHKMLDKERRWKRKRKNEEREGEQIFSKNVVNRSTAGRIKYGITLLT